MVHSAQTHNSTVSYVDYKFAYHIYMFSFVPRHTLAHSYTGSNQNNSKYNALQFVL